MIHIFLAAAGARRLFRQTLGFGGFLSVLGALIYALGPVMLYFFKSLTTVFAFSLFPWALILIIGALDKNDFLHLAGASALIGLIGLSGDVNIALRIISHVFVTALFYLVLQGISKSRLKTLFLILLFSILIALPAILGQGLGLSRLIQGPGELNSENLLLPGLTDFAAWVCPGFFGARSGSSFFMSSQVQPVSQKVFLSGFFFFLFLFSGLFVFMKKLFYSDKNNNKGNFDEACFLDPGPAYRQAFLSVSGAGLLFFVFALLPGAGFFVKTHISGYFPALKSALPGVFTSALETLIYAPQPYYWLYTCVPGCIALALSGLALLKRPGKIKSCRYITQGIICLSAFALTLILLFISFKGGPYIITDTADLTREGVQGLMKIPVKNQVTPVKWFLTPPARGVFWPLIFLGIHFIGGWAVFFISYVLRYLRNRRIKTEVKSKFCDFNNYYIKSLYLLSCLIILTETLFSAYGFFYTNQFYPEADLKKGYALHFNKPSIGPSGHALLMQARNIRQSMEPFNKTSTETSTKISTKTSTEISNKSSFKNFRFSGIFSDIDNIAWLSGAPAMAGYDCKPLFPDFKDILFRAGLTPVYKMSTAHAGEQLLKNLGVSKRLYYSFVHPGLLKPWNVSSLNLIQRDITGALPFISVQSEYRVLSKDKCADHVVNQSLLNCVVLEQNQIDKANEKIKKFEPFQSGSQVLGDQSLEHAVFGRHWENIQYLSFKNGFPVTFKVRLDKRSFIVINRCFDRFWQARVNSKEYALLKVNSFMQGIYLEKGEYIIELIFNPLDIKAGFTISLCFFVFLLFKVKRELFKKS
jgi:hypothetical protein